MASTLLPDDILQEELALARFLRQTMLSSTVGKNNPKYITFCKKAIQVPKEKRFPFAFDFFESIDRFPKIERKPMKSSEEALRLKNLGNAAFGRGHFIEALKLYTESVAVAPAGSPDLAVAYGNRSAVLFELQRYEGCIVDISRALNENCPEASRIKLQNRKQKCSKTMELNTTEFDQQKSEGKISIERKDFETKKNRPLDEDALDLDYTQKFPTPKAKLTNQSISNATDKVKIAVNSTFGRHIVAIKDMKIGEIISVEKAYSSVLLREHRYSHCANCFMRCEALIPCPDCSSVMYCSRRCREEDFNRSHRIECQIYFYSHCLGLPLPSSFRLAIQTLVVVTEQGENLKRLMKDPLSKDPMKQASGIVPEKLCSQNAVHRILCLLNDERLCSHPDDSYMLSEATVIVYYRAILISYILKQTTYFDAAMVGKTDVDKDSVEERKYVGTLFYKLVISLSKHSAAIEELLQRKVSGVVMQSEGPHSVGRGFYLFHSFFSHSCYCNVVGSQHKDTLVSRTNQPIKAGQQLCFSYGPRFYECPRIERQNHLRMGYNFDCCCVACEEDWPILDEMLLEPKGNVNLSLLSRYSAKLAEFYDNPSGLVEYNTSLFDLLCKFLRVFHGKYENFFQDYFIAVMMFEILLQSQGNNYLYTRDEVLMSL